MDLGQLCDDGEEATWALPWLRRVVCCAGIALLGATHPLWEPQSVFPQVPLLPATEWPDAVEWMWVFGLFASLCCAVGATKEGVGILSFYAVPFFWFALALGDQQRLTPWAWQLSVLAFVLGAHPRRALQLARLLLVGIYFYSAFSKFDVSFLQQMGSSFAAVLVAPLGVDPAPVWLPWMFPCGELAIAVGLALPARWKIVRGAALAGAVAMHLALLYILGPFGLQHQPGVLLWNVSFLLQALLLFGPGLVGESSSESDKDAPPVDDGRRFLVEWRNGLALVATAVALLVPLSPWCDPWFAWELYSPRSARVEVFVPSELAKKLPLELQDAGAVAVGEYWMPLRLDRASLAKLGTPLYPGPRVQLAAAIAVARKYKIDLLRVVELGPADRLTGERTSREMVGLERVEQAAREYWFNALPGGRYVQASE